MFKVKIKNQITNIYITSDVATESFLHYAEIFLGDVTEKRTESCRRPLKFSCQEDAMIYINEYDSEIRLSHDENCERIEWSDSISSDPEHWRKIRSKCSRVMTSCTHDVVSSVKYCDNRRVCYMEEVVAYFCVRPG